MISDVRIAEVTQNEPCPLKLGHQGFMHQWVDTPPTSYERGDVRYLHLHPDHVVTFVNYAMTYRELEKSQ